MFLFAFLKLIVYISIMQECDTQMSMRIRVLQKVEFLFGFLKLYAYLCRCKFNVSLIKQ